MKVLRRIDLWLDRSFSRKLIIGLTLIALLTVGYYKYLSVQPLGHGCQRGWSQQAGCDYKVDIKSKRVP